MQAITSEDKRKAAEALTATKVERMSSVQLDLAVALLLNKPVKKERGKVFVMNDDGGWRHFSPTQDWADYGEVVTNIELVAGSHARYDDKKDAEKVTGYWYSCHAFIGDTQREGNDLRRVVAESCAKLLEHIWEDIWA